MSYKVTKKFEPVRAFLMLAHQDSGFYMISRGASGQIHHLCSFIWCLKDSCQSQAELMLVHSSKELLPGWHGSFSELVTSQVQRKTEPQISQSIGTKGARWCWLSTPKRKLPSPLSFVRTFHLSSERKKGIDVAVSWRDRPWCFLKGRIRK